MIEVLAGGIGVVLLSLLVILYYWMRSRVAVRDKKEEEVSTMPAAPSLQLVHRLCPHNNVVQGFEVEQKDSLDEHLDLLTRKLAEKEGRLRISKSKIRETQNEIDNLHAIDQNVRMQYRDVMDALKSDLSSNEKECKKLQDQIEWVSRRRAELKEEVHRGQKWYGEAAAELATNLAELQRGRTDQVRVTDKPFDTNSQIRHRKVEITHKIDYTDDDIDSLPSAKTQHRAFHKEPILPRASYAGSIVIKSSPVATPLGSKFCTNNATE